MTTAPATALMAADAEAGVTEAHTTVARMMIMTAAGMTDVAGADRDPDVDDTVLTMIDMDTMTATGGRLVMIGTVNGVRADTHDSQTTIVTHASMVTHHPPSSKVQGFRLL